MTMAVSRACYATREAVKARLDVKLTARLDQVVDDALEAAAAGVDQLCHRRFYPELATRYFDWPTSQSPTSWRLWLDANELVSVTSMSSGGTTIAATDYFLRPDDGPPYTRIEIDLDSPAAFGGGDTHQRDITVTGLWGYRNDEAAAGTVAEALDASETAVDVSDSAAVGVGDLIRVDSERMLVTGRSNLDTGQNASALTASAADVAVTVADGTALATGETITVDAERMRVDDIAGNTLTVRRAWDGSVLAAHSSGADIYAPRTLTVARGAYGTTAASHSTATTIYRHVAPGLVRQYTRGLALATVLQELAGYARVVGSGDNEREASGRGLRAVRDDCYAAHGRKLRQRVIA